MDPIDSATTTTQTLERVAAQLIPLLPGDKRRLLEDAVRRASRGHARVLVFGEAKRGKSSMVNRLFGADLLPTGALPLTSVATVVTVGRELEARVRYRDGTELPISGAEVGELVSERGNPSNVKQVDRVLILAPSPLLPENTEVVDTPGTGSIFLANSNESSRARNLMDLAVLMVAADPPVSAAEIALMAEARRTASRAAVVINKADLVSDNDLPEIRAFTERALRNATETAIPLFVTSLRTGEGFDAFADWLADQLRRHGCADAVNSTVRALRREAAGLLDELCIQDRLLRDEGHRSTVAASDLSDILRRARRSAAAVTDSVRGEAVRLRRQLDEDHDRQTAIAHARMEHWLDELSDPVQSPEQDADRRRNVMISAVRDQASAWFETMAAELSTALQTSGNEAVDRLRNDLVAARGAAWDLLGLELTEPAEPARTDPPNLPRLDIFPASDWQELISTTIARHLPAAVRRTRLRRALREWSETALDQPFGRARSALQSWLENSARLIERDLTNVWDAQIAALERAMTAVQQLDEQTEPERATALDRIAERSAAVHAILTQLDACHIDSPPFDDA